MTEEIEPIIEQDEDFDFDFSIYAEEEQEEEVRSIRNFKRPNVTGLRSRFSNGQRERDRIADICDSISKRAIGIHAQIQDPSLLREFYGFLCELWESFRNIFGEVINFEISQIKNKCLNLINGCHGGQIAASVHNNLLYFQNRLYTLKQLCNLGIDVERTSRSVYAKAKRQIIQ